MEAFISDFWRQMASAWFSVTIYFLWADAPTRGIHGWFWRMFYVIGWLMALALGEAIAVLLWIGIRVVFGI